MSKMMLINFRKCFPLFYIDLKFSVYNPKILFYLDPVVFILCQERITLGAFPLHEFLYFFHVKFILLQ